MTKKEQFLEDEVERLKRELERAFMPDIYFPEPPEYHRPWRPWPSDTYPPLCQPDPCPPYRPQFGPVYYPEEYPVYRPLYWKVPL